MNTPKHTPAPWHFAIPCGHSVKTISIRSGDPKQRMAAFAVVYNAYTPDSDQALANARLISAAPDLLEALRKAVERQGFTNDELIEARALIANAMGSQK